MARGGVPCRSPRSSFSSQAASWAHLALFLSASSHPANPCLREMDRTLASNTGLVIGVRGV